MISEAAVPPAWRDGDVILDVYRVVGSPIRGGMGEVHRVRHLGWGIDLAVKRPRQELCATEAQIREFERECEAWVALGTHPNTVSCAYVRRLDGVPHVFAEWVDGGSLAQWVSERRLYDKNQAAAMRRMLDVAIQFAWGLAYAHQEGLVHRDVKPANVMLTPAGAVKVTDFGLARARAAAGEGRTAPALRTPFASRGGMTLEYCSPEQAERRAGSKLSDATDVWSWAISVLEMFVGRPPCRGGDTGEDGREVFESFLNTGAEDEAIPALPLGLTEVLDCCLRRNPRNRPTMREVADALMAVYEHVVGEPWNRPVPAAAAVLADGLSNQALSLLDLGRREQAQALLDRAVQVDPHNAHAVYNRGLRRWRGGQASDAALVAELEAVRRRDHTAAVPAFLLGLVHLERGDNAAARVALDDAARHAPADPDIAAARASAERAVRTTLPATLPAGPVHGVAISGDGRTALTGEFHCRVWDLTTGRELCRVEGHGTTLSSRAISHDGRVAASAEDRTVRTWEVPSGRCRWVLDHDSTVRGVALTGDAAFAVSCGGETVRVWDLATGECVRRLIGPQPAVAAVAVSTNAHTVLTGHVDGSLRFWDLRSGRCWPAIPVPIGKGIAPAAFPQPTGINAVALSADGSIGISSSAGRPGLRVWESSSGRCMHSLHGHTGAIAAVDLSADGKFAISVGVDGTGRVWETSSGRCTRVLDRTTEHPTIASVAISADGGVAVWGSGLMLCRDDVHTVGVWDLRPRPRSPYSYARPGAAEELNRSASEVAVALRRARMLLQEGSWAAAAHVVSGPRRKPDYERDPEVLDVWWQAAAGGRRTALRAVWPSGALSGHTGAVTAVVMSAGGERAVTGGEDGTIRFWDFQSRRLLHTVAAHSDQVSSVAMSADGRVAVSCAGDTVDPTQPSGSDTVARVWDVDRGREMRALHGHTSGLLAVALSASGHRVLTGSSDRTLRFWDAASGRCLRTVTSDSGVLSVAMTHDCRWAVLGGGYRAVPVIELGSGQYRQSVDASYIVGPVAISVSGRIAVAGAWNGGLEVWALPSGQLLHTLAGHGEFVRVTSLAMSADATFAVSADWNGGVRIWDLRTGNSLEAIEGHTGWVHSLAVTANGRRLLTGSSDGTARVWELDWDFEFPASRD